MEGHREYSTVYLAQQSSVITTMYKIDQMLAQYHSPVFILLREFFPSHDISVATFKSFTFGHTVYRIISASTCDETFAAGSVLTAYPIIREAVVCVERGLRQVNNP